MQAPTLQRMNSSTSTLSTQPTAAGGHGLTFAMLLLAQALAGLDQTIVATALPSIGRSLQAANGSTWVFTAYLLTATVAVPLYGRLADSLGVRTVLLAALALVLGGSALCAASPDILSLALARALQGLGGGGLMTLTMLAAGELVPSEQRARHFGLLGSAYAVSTLLGPLVGGALLSVASWRWIFVLNLPLLLGALVVLNRRMPAASQRGPRRSLDWAGALLLVVSLVCLVLGTRRGAAGAAPDTTEMAVLLTAALLSGGLFVASQRRSKTPIMPLDLLARRQFARCCAVAIVSGLALFAAVVFAPMVFQAVSGLSPLVSGLHLMPLMLGIAVASALAGRAFGRSAEPSGWAAGALVVTALGFAAMAAAVRMATGGALGVSAGLLPVGAGLGVLFPLVAQFAQRDAPPQQIGAAIAVPTMFRSIGGAVGIALLGGLLSRGMAPALGTGQSLPAALVAGLLPVFGSVAALCALMAAWLLSTRRA